MYSTIEKIRPYFFSLREIKETLCLDVKYPIKWTIETIVERHPQVQLKIQDRNEEVCLLSLMSTADNDGFKATTNCALGIIKHNLDQELKERLFQEKVNELQLLFFNKSLDELQALNFTKEDGNGNQQGDKKTSDRTDEISEGTGETETEID